MNQDNDSTVKNSKSTLIQSDAFEKALLEGAEYKKEIMTTYKEQNKSNYDHFYEVMLEAKPEIKKLFEKKRKQRTDADIKQMKDFRSEVRQLYCQTQDLMLEEKLEEGQKSKAQKIVEKILPVIAMLRFVKCHKLDNVLARLGFQLSGTRIEDMYPGLAADGKQAVIEDIFTSAKTIKEKVNNDNQQIEDRIFTVNVPADLQYDKQSNNSGLKPGDFRKLVDAKTKLIMAKTDDAKQKASEKIEHIASEKQFEMARAELVRDSLMNMH